MKRLAITRLSLVGFKGQDRQLNLGGESAAIYGPNGSGKTTIADAIAWALTGKDSQGRQPGRGFSILGAGDTPGESAEAEIEIEGVGASPLVLRRIYRALVDDAGVVTGNTTDFWVNGIPVKAGEYAAEIASICEPEMWAAASSPVYFAETLTWKRRRELVMKIAGEIAPSELLALAPDLGRLLVMSRPVAQTRRRAAADKAAAKKALDEIPARMSEAGKVLKEEPPEMPAQGVADELDRLKAERAEVLAEMERIRQGGQVAELRKGLAEIEAEIQRAETEHRRSEDERLEGLRKALAEARAATREAVARSKQAAAIEETAEGRCEALAADLQALESRRDDLLPIATEDICSACGQEIPPDLREKLGVDANRARSILLEDFAEKIAAAGEKVANAKREFSEFSEAVMAERAAFKAASVAEQEAEATVKNFEPAPFDRPNLEDRRQDLLDKIAGLVADARPEIEARAEHLADIDEAIAAAEAVNLVHRQRAHAQKRVGDLKAEAANIRTALGAAEALLRLCDLRDETMGRLLESRAGKLAEIFGDTVRFQLFRRQVNGDFEERCDVTSPDGRRFTGELSGGERIQAGLAICRGVQKWLNFAPPVVIDEAESVTSPIEMPGQVIRLIASDQHQELTVERG